MGRTATTLGVVLVLVLLGVVVLIVYTGGKGSPQAAEKPTSVASNVPDKKKTTNPIVPSGTKSQTPAPSAPKNDRRITPAAPSTQPAPSMPRAATPSGGDTANAVTPPAGAAPTGDAAKTPPAAPAGSGDTTVKKADETAKTGSDAKTPLLDHSSYLADAAKKTTTEDKTAPPAAPKTTNDAKAGGTSSTTTGAGLTGGTADVGGAKPEYTTYTTKRDDTLWVLSVRFLHDGTKWREILKLNPSLPPDGSRLPEGFQLRIPSAAPAKKVEPPPPVVAPANTRAYTLKSGDKLWNLALRLYGDGSLYKEILAANPGLDESRLPPGKTIFLPVIPGKGPKGMDAPAKN